MNAREQTIFRKRLIAEKERLEEEIRASNRFNMEEPLTDSVQELSAYDNHPADLGSETFEREKDLALWNNTHELLQRIKEALDHVDKGIYGVCEDCGEEIALERLEAVPYTTLCIHCQHQEEDNHQSRERPIEEEVLGPPFGRTFLDGTDVVATDGEDIWQDVARYGTSESPSDLGGVADYEDTYLGAEEEQGIVEGIDSIIEVGPDEIGPRPREYPDLIKE
ncbi:MAG: conjugal transfer protein TraR [Firmicutes bacterium]|nr:conjugal transfer protein TraR [Bacillota bacterium]